MIRRPLSRWPAARAFLVLCCLPVACFLLYRPQRQKPGGWGDAFTHSAICPDKACSWSWGDVKVAKQTEAGLLHAQSNESCLSMCPVDIMNARCEVGDASSAVQKSLSALYKLIGARKTIQPAELLSMFDLTKDPCRRGPTAFSPAGITNFGDECLVRTEFADAGLQVAIQIPARLEGRFATPSSTFRLNFAPDTAPVIHIYELAADVGGKPKLHGLDATFGGTALWVEADGKRAFFKTRGCVGVGLN